MTTSDTHFVGGLPIGSRLHEYRIENVLGHGGFGITYLAQDTHLNKAVAIKEYLPSDLAVRVKDTEVSVRSAQTQEAFNWGRSAFLREAQILARFSHPNLVHIYRFFEAHNTAYFVMEYAEGTTFASVLRGEGTLDEDRILKVILPILDGLEVVHKEGILHRDIKPDNILLRGHTPVLIDFGAARHSLSSASRSIMSVATGGYSPLEQYSSGITQGPWTDLYALAAVVYRAITGNKPPDAVDRVRQDPYLPASMIGFERYSASFLGAVDWALAVDVEDRPRNVDEWKQALNGAVEPRVKFKTVTVPIEDGKTEAIRPQPGPIDATEMIQRPRPPGARERLRAFALQVRDRVRPRALLQRTRAALARAQEKPAALAAAGVLAAATVGLAVYFGQSSQLAVPDSSDPEESEEAVDAGGAAEPPAQQTLMQAKLAYMQAQVDFSHQRFTTAVNNFRKALELNPELQNEARLAKQLVFCLRRDYDTAAALIKQYPSRAIVAELSRMSGQSGPIGRGIAARMLQSMGLRKRIDHTGAALGDLDEAENCEGRLQAVRRLGELNDKRALPALRALLEGGKTLGGKVVNWLENACLRSEAQAIVEQLERR